MIRGTVRPLAEGAATLRGLRVTGFYDNDAYVKNAERSAASPRDLRTPVGQRQLDYLWATDQTRTVKPRSWMHGYSVWITPKTTKGWEGLLRFDHLSGPGDGHHRRENATHDRRRGLLVPRAVGKH